MLNKKVKRQRGLCLFLMQCSPWMLGMTKHHKRILEQGGLLDDLVIYAALILL